jgi:hypothetical protein
MVSKVDRTVDSCIIYKKIATVARLRSTVDFSWILPHRFQWESGLKITKFVQNGLKISKKKSVKANMSTTWQIRAPATVDFSRES